MARHCRAAPAALAAAIALAGLTAPLAGPLSGPPTAAAQSASPRRPADVGDAGADGDVRPLRWVDRSRQDFQRIMRRLAERSAGMHPAEPPLLSPGRPPPEWDWRPTPPARPSTWEAPDEDRRPARHELERERARTPAWPPHAARCRRAGVPVEGGGWYVVAPGDTLWSIAETHYGDGRVWRRIVDANRRRLPDPSCIYACQRLHIPASRPEPEWEESDHPARHTRNGEAWWVRPTGPARPEEPIGSGPRGCADCGAGSHVSARSGNGRSADREWR